MRLYHVGFGLEDLPMPPPALVLLSGDPDRAAMIATTRLTDPRELSTARGLTSYVGTLDGTPVLSCTSGMGGPSASIAFNELVQLGITTVIRVGTCGSIQAHVAPGSVVISSASLCRQGAADDIAPVEYPASADPFLTVTLADAARRLGHDFHVGLTASVDTFFEGQERSVSSANPTLLRRLQGQTEELRALNILNYEMESGTLFKAGLVYGVAVGCVCAVVAQRTEGEQVVLESKATAVDAAIDVAVEGAGAWLARAR